MKKLLLLIIPVLLGAAAYFVMSNSKAEENDVFIRFKNTTPYNYSGIRSGTTIAKDGSKKGLICATVYPELKTGETSEYKATRGKFEGYSRVTLLCDEDPKIFKKNRYTIVKKSNKSYQKQFATHATEAQSYTNPYTEKVVKGKGFPKGNYTYTIKINENNGRPILLIKKDK